MTRWHLLWLLASFGLSLGANHTMKPKVEYALSPGQATLATGTLRFDGMSDDIKVVNVYVVAQDLRRVLAEPLRVRELLIRSPEPVAGQAPDLELFFDFSANHVIEADARDVAQLRERDLPLLANAIGSEARSRVRFPGAAAPVFAREGTLRITEVYELQGEVGASWRISADVQLTLNEAPPRSAGAIQPSGGSDRTVKGKLNARLTW